MRYLFIPATAAVAVALSVSGASRTPSRTFPAAPEARVVSLSGNIKNAREPQAAIDTFGNVYIAFGAGNAIYCSVSRNKGQTFDTPVKIGEVGKLSLGMRRGPRIAVAGESVVVSAIYERASSKGRSGDLMAWRSRDGGKTWQGPALISDVPGAAREGLHAMAASADGKSVACAWLDLRGKGTEIYLSRSQDGGANWTKNALVYASPDGTVCECCHPSLAWGPKGELLVMWRNSLGGARDMYLAHENVHGKTFGAARKLGAGTWPLNACPMDGGALAVAPDGKVIAVWRRDQDMFVCEPGGREKRLGRGQQGWVAATNKGVYAVWLEGRPGRLMALSPGETTARALAEGADDPVAACSPSGRGPVVVTWSEGAQGESKVYSKILSGTPGE